MKPCCPGLCLPNETPCPSFLSVLRLTSPLLLHPGKRRRRRRGGAGGGNESKRSKLPTPPALLLFTSYIICMFRIRKDIHRDVVRWDSWRTKNKKGGRRKRGVTTKVCRNLVTFDLVVFSFISGKITVTGKKIATTRSWLLKSKKKKGGGSSGGR